MDFYNRGGEGEKNKVLLNRDGVETIVETVNLCLPERGRFMPCVNGCKTNSFDIGRKESSGKLRLVYV